MSSVYHALPVGVSKDSGVSLQSDNDAETLAYYRGITSRTVTSYSSNRTIRSSESSELLQYPNSNATVGRATVVLARIIIAIFAFATTTSVYTSSQFSLTCGNGSTVSQDINFGYPFRLHNFKFDLPLCPGTPNATTSVGPYGDYSSSSQFYVFVGVMAFLYSLAAIVLYVCFDDKYRKYDQIPIADFIITAVFTVLWLISSVAWADDVSKVKRYTDPKEFWINASDADYVYECDLVGNKCETVKQDNFASLNVSIIFGFLNMCVWGGNLWFLFKETKWFKVQSQHPEQRTDPAVVESQDPQRV